MSHAGVLAAAYHKSRKVINHLDKTAARFWPRHMQNPLRPLASAVCVTTFDPETHSLNL